MGRPPRLPQRLRAPAPWILALAVLVFAVRDLAALHPEAATALRSEAATVLRMLAFWVALLGWNARSGCAGDAGRFVAGLAVGAALAHVGWALLHPEVLRARPAWATGQAGFAVVFVPLGLLSTAPSRRDPARRSAYLAAALASLPDAVATARLGCLLDGCCNGVWLAPTLAPLLDAGLALALGQATGRGLGPRAVVAALAAANLANHALREPDLSSLTPAALAAIAVGLGGGWWAGPCRTDRR